MNSRNQRRDAGTRATLVGLPSCSRTPVEGDGFSVEMPEGLVDDTQVMEVWPSGVLVEGTAFRVVRLLGTGGMGDVYEVRREEGERHYALKLLRPVHRERRDLAERMREEARLLSLVRHENLVRLVESGTLAGDGRPYLVLELLCGRDLRRERERHGVLSAVAALGFIAQALDGLEALHRAGYVHRDVKLQNLFLCESGTLKVLDVGIAKPMAGGTERTGPGQAIGTSRAMAPEQHAGGPVDGRTDVYGAGLALYELVAGRGPFDAFRGNEQAMRFAHCIRPVPPISEAAPQAVPARLDAIVQKALAKRPGDRFGSAAEMAEALRCLRMSLMGGAAGRIGWRRRASDAKAEAIGRARVWAGAALGAACRRAGIRVDPGY